MFQVSLELCVFDISPVWSMNTNRLFALFAFFGVFLGSPKMYMHMVKTRKKQFAERKKELEAKKA